MNEIEKLNDIILEKIRSLWDISGNFNYLQKVKNYIYELNEDQLIVRVTENRHRTKDELISELDWMDYLCGGEIEFAHPIKSNNQNFVEEISDNSKLYFAVVFKRAKGIGLNQAEDFTPNLYQRWKRLVASLICWNDFWEPMVEGYLSENNLDAIWIERIQNFARFRTALIYYWCKAKIKEGSFESPDWAIKAMAWSEQELAKKVQLI